METKHIVLSVFFLIVIIGIGIALLINKEEVQTSKFLEYEKSVSSENILEKQRFGEQEVIFLARQCYERYNGQAGKEVCYMLNAIGTESNDVIIIPSEGEPPYLRVNSSTNPTKAFIIYENSRVFVIG